MPRIKPNEWRVYPSTQNEKYPDPPDNFTDAETAYYLSYVRLPHARSWRSAEFRQAIRAARLAAYVDTEFKAALYSELRQLENLMGVTASGRRVARIQWENDDEY